MQLLANGKQQFIDANGAPLASGKVYFYAPGTLTPSTTYQDAAGTVPNTNPVNLDSAGQGVIWGTGSYRQIVKDSVGNQIWDQIVATPDLNAPLAGLSGASGSALVGYGATNLAALVKGSIGQVMPSVAALKLIDKTKYTQAFVTGYYAPGDGGGGMYYYDAADAASTDNAGTVIVAADGGRWKLLVSGDISVRQFGAKGDNTADDTAAINACFTWAGAKGKVVYAPAGTYKLTARLVIDNSADTTFPSRRLSLRGDGARNTLFSWAAGASGGLGFIGSATGGGIISEQYLKDIALIKSDTLGDGLDLVKMDKFLIDNVYIAGFATGLAMVDCLSLTVSNSQIRFNKLGVQASKGTFTQPNAITFLSTVVGNNLNSGLDIKNSSTFCYFGGSIENNNGGADAVKFGVRVGIYDAALEGSVAAMFQGVYFENNGSDTSADLVYENTVAPSGIVVQGCTFNRGNQFFGTNCIRINTSGGSRQQVTLIGNGFRSFNGYVPDVNRPYVGIVNPDDPLQVVDLGNAYLDTLETPDFNSPYITRQAVSSAWCRFDGTLAGPTLVASQAQNVKLITKNGTGDYTITYRRALSSGTNAYDSALLGVGVVQIFAESATTVRVKTFNLAGAPADFVMSVGVKGGMTFA